MSDGLGDWFSLVLKQHDERVDAIADAHQQLVSNGLLSRVTVLRYMCGRGCQLATVFRISGTTLCATRDYKYSPGMNEAQSVPTARVKNTLDGDRHWPSHVFDVEALAEWGVHAGMSINCRHYRGTLNAVDVLATVGDTAPGKPIAPIRLGVS